LKTIRQKELGFIIIYIYFYILCVHEELLFSLKLINRKQKSKVTCHFHGMVGLSKTNIFLAVLQSNPINNHSCPVYISASIEWWSTFVDAMQNFTCDTTNCFNFTKNKSPIIRLIKALSRSRFCQNRNRLDYTSLLTTCNICDYIHNNEKIKRHLYCGSLYISGQISNLALFVGTCTKIYQSLIVNTFFIYFFIDKLESCIYGYFIPWHLK